MNSATEKLCCFSLKEGFHQRRSPSRNRKRESLARRNRSQKNQSVSIFFRFRLRLHRLRSAYDLVKTRLPETEAEVEG